MRLLSVDFDFFFPLPSDAEEQFRFYDWQHADSPIYAGEIVWNERAAWFRLNGRPLPQTTGEENRFWQRIKLRKGAKLFYADSHVFAFDRKVREAIAPEFCATVTNFDAHHDCGYRETPESIFTARKVNCANWLVGYSMLGANVSVVYPEWRRHALAELHPSIRVRRNFDQPDTTYGPFDHVFLCRSAAWLPTWVEEKFWQFLDACPVPAGNRVRLQEFKRREFDPEVVAALAEFQSQSRAVFSCKCDIEKAS